MNHLSLVNRHFRSFSFTNSFKTGILTATGVCIFITGLDLLAQTDDFNDGNDTGWTHTDLSTGTGGLLPGAQYTFPSDGNGGKAYRILAPAPPAPDAGPARSSCLQSAKYSRFSVGVDLLAWDVNPDQAFGIITRVGNTGLGSTDGYVLNYNSFLNSLQINELNNESPTTIAEVGLFLKQNKNRYRLVFSGYDQNLLGQVFALPDTNTPIASVVAVESQHESGQAGLMVFNRADVSQYTDAASFADATFDNYSASVPATGTLSATIFSLSPAPGAIVNKIPSSIQVAILNRESDVDPDKVTLIVDGKTVPQSDLTLTTEIIAPKNSTPFPGLTLVYTPSEATNLAGMHTNRIQFVDGNGKAQTHEWVYSYATLVASNASPTDSGEISGFGVRLVQAPLTGPALANNLIRAEQQLAANPPANLVAFSTNVILPVINLSQKNTNDPGYTPEGQFGNDSNFPGIDPAVQSDPNDMAMEIFTYLQLDAGIHTFGVICDDGFQLRSGDAPSSSNAVVLGECVSGTFNGTFDFVVEKDGIYPFRMVWFERGGGAHVELFHVDRFTGEKSLINASDCPVKAFVSLVAPSVVVESSSILKPGSFSVNQAAAIDAANKTITIPALDAQGFYRLKSGQALQISHIQLSGTNVILNYK